jgi:hypothetical protein
MDADRRSEVTDAALDSELQAMLGVDPSPEFVARVRTRIADQPSPSSSWFGAWSIAASIAVAVAAAMVVLVLSRDASNGAPSERPVLDSRTAIRPAWPMPDLTGLVLGGSDRPAPRAGRSRTAARQEPTAPARAEPEILVDAREAAALRALIFGAQQGRIDLAPMLAASTPAVMELPPVVDIAIPDITIEPLAPGTGAEGVRQ